MTKMSGTVRLLAYRKQEQKTKDLGYRLWYIRQFALISASYAKLQVGMGLAGSPITLDYALLS